MGSRSDGWIDSAYSTGDPEKRSRRSAVNRKVFELTKSCTVENSVNTANEVHLLFIGDFFFLPASLLEIHFRSLKDEAQLLSVIAFSKTQ